MLKNTMKILVVEANPDDVELTPRAIKKNRIADPIEVVLKLFSEQNP